MQSIARDLAKNKAEYAMLVGLLTSAWMKNETDTYKFAVAEATLSEYREYSE